MEIKLAKKNDIEELNVLFKDVIKDLKEVKKIDMLWGDVYPFCEFETDIANNEMYIIKKDNKLIGSFVLSNFDDPDYKEIDWDTNLKKFIYLKILINSTKEQGKGYAKKVMTYIDEYAQNNNLDSIRLTVYEKNINAIRLYEKNGFKRIQKGNWQLEDRIFIGFEKKMK